MNVKDHIKGYSHFQVYRKGELWYKTDDTHFTFNVPADDTGDAAFGATEKSLHLMRYIRKFIAAAEREKHGE